MQAWQRQLWLLLAAAFLSLMGFNFVFPFLPLLVQNLGVVDPQRVAIWSGLVISVAGGASIVGQPIWGYLSDRHGRKPMLLRAILGAGGVLFLLSLVRSLWQLLVLRGLFGFLAGTNASSNTMIAQIVPRSQLGRALGRLQTASQLSATLGPLAGGLIAATLGLRGAFLAAGCLALLAGGIAIFGVREYAPPHDLPETLPRQAAASVLPGPINWPALVLPLAALVAMIVSVSLLAPTMPALVAAARRAPASTASTGLAFSLLGLASAAGAVSVGRPERRLGREGTLLAGLLLAIVAEIGLFAAQAWPAFLLCLALLGLGQGLVLPMGSALLAARSEAGRLGTVFGVASSVQSIGSASGPLLGGALAAGAGLHAIFPVGALLLLGGTLPLVAPHVLGGQTQPARRTQTLARRG